MRFLSLLSCWKIISLICGICFLNGCGLFETDEERWSDSMETVYDYEAVNYCANLRENGYSGWRIPTISELRTLIQNCPSIETDGSCKITDYCLNTENCMYNSCKGCDYAASSDGKYSKLGDIDTFWSSSENEEGNQYWVNFSSASIELENGSSVHLKSIRCIRDK